MSIESGNAANMSSAQQSPLSYGTNAPVTVTATVTGEDVGQGGDEGDDEHVDQYTDDSADEGTDEGIGFVEEAERNDDECLARPRDWVRDKLKECSMYAILAKGVRAQANQVVLCTPSSH